jgi:hypothetical protein
MYAPFREYQNYGDAFDPAFVVENWFQLSGVRKKKTHEHILMKLLPMQSFFSDQTARPSCGG